MPLEYRGCVGVVSSSQGAVVTIAGTGRVKTEQRSGLSG